MTRTAATLALLLLAACSDDDSTEPHDADSGPLADAGGDVSATDADTSLGDVAETDAPVDALETDADESDSALADSALTDSASPDASPTLTTVSGVAQKGPLVAGSALTLQVLDGTLTQTGESFSADIQDNEGSFSLGDVDLGGNPFLEIFADGFYYNEVTNEISNDRLALFTLAEPSVEDININVLSHLERPRTRHLYENPSEVGALNVEGTLSDDDVRGANTEVEIFRAAKAQAQSEVLAAFEVDASSFDLDSSETLNIEGTGAGDQVLTAISVILQSYRSVGEMTELLANLSLDLEPDGTLESQGLLNDLFTAASFVNTDTVVEHLAERFDGLNASTAAGFVVHFEAFLDGTSGVLDGGPELPEESPVVYARVNGEELASDQPNVLRESATCIHEGTFGVAAVVPDRFGLEVVLTVTEGYVGWFVDSDVSGWDVFGDNPQLPPESETPPDGSLDNIGVTQGLVTDLASEVHEAEIRFQGQGVVQVEYFANGLSGAYLTRSITVNACEFTTMYMDPDDPEAMPVMASVCDYSSSMTTCDDPLERNETPDVDEPRP